jgi:hypothetical protein
MLRNYSTFTFVFFISLSLTACVPMYQEPAATKPAAKIDFNSNLNFSGEMNLISIYDDSISCKGEKRTVRAGFDNKPQRVTPDKTLTFSYFHQKYLGIKTGYYDYNKCLYIVSFIPKANKLYNVKVTEGVEINGKYSCDFSLYNQTDKKSVKYIERYHEDNFSSSSEFPKQCNDGKLSTANLN